MKALQIAKFLSQLLICFSLSHCILGDVLPQLNQKKKKSTPPAAEVEEQPPAEEKAVAEALPSGRLLRRLSIDLLHRLPPAEEINGYESGELPWSSLVDNYLSQADHANAMGALHETMWGFFGTSLPDLDRLVDGGDTTLSEALTSTVRSQVIDEPGLLVRYIISENRPYMELFSLNYTIAHTDVLTLWGYTAGDAPWEGEPYRFATYTDSRPNLGPLASNGFWAKLDSENRSSNDHRWYKILNKLACVNLNNGSAHHFIDLSNEEMASNPTSVASTKGPCVGCHNQFGVGSLLNGMASGTTGAEWAAYTAPTVTTAYYAGASISATSSLTNLVRVDPRIQRCSIQSIMEQLLHRPFFSDRDLPLLMEMMKSFYASLGRLTPTIKLLANSSTYASAVQGEGSSKDLAASTTGVKFLSRSQFLSIFKQISYAAAQLDIPRQMEPGAFDIDGRRYKMPGPNYWYYVDKIARQAATAIVGEELADNTSAASRKLLAEIPDGSGSGASGEQVTSQIISLWKLLTSETLADSDARLTQLVAIYNAGVGSAAADEDYRNAWRSVFIALLSSYEFVTY